MKEIIAERLKQEQARAKAWANYVKVRDAEDKRHADEVEKIKEKFAGVERADWQKKAAIEERVEAEVKARVKKEYEAAQKKYSDTQAKKQAALDAAAARRRERTEAAWQAFEILDIGGKTKKR